MSSRVMSKKKKNYNFLFALPYATVFFVFVVLLIFISFVLSFFRYDTINTPTFIGFENYVNLFTRDQDFLQYAVPNTIKYALIVGPIGYLLSQFQKIWNDNKDVLPFLMKSR